MAIGISQIGEIDMQTLITRALQAVEDAKQAHPGILCLCRIGDFYEAFGDDVEVICRVCGLSPTTRGELAMVGFPVHAKHYLVKLVSAGFRVATLEEF